MLRFHAGRKKRIVLIIIAVILTVVLALLSRYVESHRDLQFGIGRIILPASSFLGVVQAMKGLLCQTAVGHAQKAVVVHDVVVGRSVEAATGDVEGLAVGCDGAPHGGRPVVLLDHEVKADASVVLHGIESFTGRNISFRVVRL